MGDLQKYLPVDEGRQTREHGLLFVALQLDTPAGGLDEEVLSLVAGPGHLHCQLARFADTL